MKKKIAITIGEPGGIGPEVTLKALIDEEIKAETIPIVIGNKAVLKETIGLLNIPMKLNPIVSPDEATHGVINFIDIPCKGFQKSMPTEEGGRASFAFIKKGVELALKRDVHAIVTAPISKSALKMAGLSWHGHTEMIAELTNTKDFRMMLIGGTLRVILATIHTALRNVPNMLSKDRVLKTILFAKRACHMLNIEEPNIGVAGLNPHAGEAGLFGDEEEVNISPAILKAKAQGINVSGPYPPDTVFFRALRGEFDIVLAMYHDQGLIPIKLHAFEKGVNVTVGLPIIRTSPDHGTAYDISWRAVANPSSMIEAIKLSLSLRL
ncbi:MAG: 4-hydroxythreonine-4-phosphate dehydrogenase PdxA [Nitrospirae bacterium]|nr:4-hydroxythreonine-4-phosphate dehydrogenase PdxA [Nitrospirota bacterium]